MTCAKTSFYHYSTTFPTMQSSAKIATTNPIIQLPNFHSSPPGSPPRTLRIMLRVFCRAHAICSPYNKVGRRQKRFYKSIRTTAARSSTTPHALECNLLVSPPGGLPGGHTGNRTTRSYLPSPSSVSSGNRRASNMNATTREARLMIYPGTRTGP